MKKNYETPPAFFMRLIHTKYHLKKVVDKVYHLLQKRNLIVIVIK